MKRASIIRALALVLAVLMCFGIFAACNKTPTPTATPVATPDNSTPLVVGYADFSEKFSPFFADTAYDQDVAEFTGTMLLTTDRAGGIVYNAIEGETIPYNGTDYTYKGIANVSVDYDEAKNQTTYTWTLREGVKFSDGVTMTADDIIFNYYTYLDPSYVGSTTLYSVDIVGLQNYRTQTTPEIYDKYLAIFEAIYAAGEDHVWSSADSWTQEMQTFFWNNMKQIWMDDVKAIVDYVYANYLSYAPDYLGFTGEEVSAKEGLKVALGMRMWGFGSYQKETIKVKADAEGNPVKDANGEYILAAEGEASVDVKVDAKDANGNKIFKGAVTGTSWDLVNTFPTLEDYYNECYAAYEGDPVEYFSVEAADDTDVYGTAQSAFILEWGPKDEALGGKGIPNIEGIKKVDDKTVQVVTNGYSATAIYTLGVIVAPLHYYGDTSKYDYANNKFGFDFGDLSKQLSKTTQPLGAGPYKFIKYENNVVYFEANENYYKGAPKTKFVQFKETNDGDMVAGVGTGVLDIANPSFSTAAVEEIKTYNSNKELSGDAIETITVDNLGYGYIGINASTVNVGGVPDSDASKNLRRGFATLLAAYRDLSIDSYYGERASIINYPISNTSWAAPQPTDEGYQVAFSTGVDGKAIYTSAMTPDQKYAAALQAAIGFFKAAGFTWDETAGKFTAAPAGAKLEYEIIVPGEGEGDHPSFIICESVRAALEPIGIKLTINDPANDNVLWDKLDAGTQELWCAAWGATIDPDMYQVYHSSGVVGAGGSDSNHYHITDDELDRLIVEARKSDDQSYRKSIYKACLDIIIDWAVEVPIYQRQNCFIFSSARVKMDTVTPDITTFWDWLNDVELLEMQ